jgi:hypothetical protein
LAFRTYIYVLLRLAAIPDPFYIPASSFNTGTGFDNTKNSRIERHGRQPRNRRCKRCAGRGVMSVGLELKICPMSARAAFAFVGFATGTPANSSLALMCHVL